MATLKSKRLQDALKKARNVGRAEESVTIDECALVLRGLPPGDYEAIVNETQELDGIAYYQGYQMGHVCRSIVEIEGVDLREVDFIEDEVPAGQHLINAVCSKGKAEEAKTALAELGISLTVVPPDGSEGERVVKVERHEWVRQRVSQWSREAISILYRKFADVVTEGETRAREKIEFKVPNETNEEKFRRLLGEAKELEAQLPPDLTKKVLEDAGYLQKASAAELQEIAERARAFAIEQAKAREAEEAQTTPIVTPAPPPERPVMTTVPPQSPQQEELMDRVRNRVPLNQIPMQAPAPMTTSAPPPQPVSAPAQFQNLTPESRARAAQIAALEGNVDPNLVAHDPQGFPVPSEIAELSSNIAPVDGRGVKGILDQRPAVGINPRFRRPT